MTTRTARKRVTAKGRPARQVPARGPAVAAPTSLLPSLARHQTLEELAYRDIRQAIMAGRLAPG
ncbi:MAG TPA: hypothetical protein VFX28_05820, partial [Methylomirabilota bacterium]|nr:hypothetical protein [Methylomirabilota bacterium]